MSKNPSVAIHPTLFMFLWVVLAFGLQYLWPLQLPELALLGLFGKIGLVLGGLIMIWAQIVFRRHDTTTEHSKPTTSLIVDGPFRFSRNPIYVALIVIFIGLAMVYRNAWGLILVIPFGIAVLRFTIMPEEEYLEREFRAEYTHYRSSVRRWL